MSKMSVSRTIRMILYDKSLRCATVKIINKKGPQIRIVNEALDYFHPTLNGINLMNLAIIIYTRTKSASFQNTQKINI